MMENNLTIKRSEQINEIVAALSKAQGEIRPAVFNRVNPHFKNRYADFTSCMDAARGPLSKNGLAISQMPSTASDGKLMLVTLLAHTSGQWIAGEFPLISSKPDSQGIGSAMTYAKRYSLCGMIGIVADEDVDANDDDGEASVGRGKSYDNNTPTPRQVSTSSSDKVGRADIIDLNKLLQNLDEESTHSFFDWISKNFDAQSLEDLPKYCFDKCILSLNNKIKYINDKNKQQNQQSAVA